VSGNQDWFVFRGERDYLHSTTLFDFILAEYAGNAGVPQHIDFTFVHKTNRICRVEVTNQGNAGLVASYNDVNCQYYLYETDLLIERREPYSEPVEGDAYVIAGECVSIPGIGENNSFIELAVAAYKGLLTSILPEFRERYVFARMKLDRIPASLFEICYKRKVAKHFFEGEIRVDGIAVGLIYFGI
jgi:hypothetical protein